MIRLITFIISGHAGNIILMGECDSKFREICFNRAFVITQIRKNITNPWLPRVASRRLVYRSSRC